jgi:hypothetical protein
MARTRFAAFKQREKPGPLEDGQANWVYGDLGNNHEKYSGRPIESRIYNPSFSN